MKREERAFPCRETTEAIHQRDWRRWRQTLRKQWKVVGVEGICLPRSGRFKQCSVIYRGALETVRKQKSNNRLALSELPIVTS